MRYYEFSGGWVKETVESGRLTRRLYTGDPRTDGNAKLHNTTVFDGETEESAWRFREGRVMADGHTQWGPWRPV
jgi:hypothetical protein